MPEIRHRFFFALKPPLAQLPAIASRRDLLIPRGYSPVTDPRLHLTLAVTRDFTSFPRTLAAVLCAAGDTIAVDPFAVTLDRQSGSANVRGDGRGSVALRPSVRPPGLGDLSRQLCRRMRHHGLLRPGWHFNPHITLLYWQGQPFLIPIEPIRWTAIEFVLIHSIVGATRHIELGRWPLRSAQAAFSFADAV